MLKYLGGAYLAGLPARDISEGDLQVFFESGNLAHLGETIESVTRAIIASGLYKSATKRKSQSSKGKTFVAEE